MLPATNEIATLGPTSIPEPMKAGVHSINQPQLSIVIADFTSPKMNSHVNGCQS